MKKTINANIGGFAFIVDEDAFKVLRRYLNEIDIRLEGEESREVLEDIERRIADIFNENITPRIQVVNIDLVKRAIAIIGNAEEFGEPHGQATTSECDYEDTQSYSQERRKKLYRNRKNAVLGGVCAGIADYFNIDITLVRILTFILIFFGGISLWIYIILWIILPREPIRKFNLDNARKRRE